MEMKIDILGTKYTLKRVDKGQDDYLDKNNFSGCCDDAKKEILILNLDSVPEWKTESIEAIMRQEKETIRHEIIHAFLNESGLQWNSFAPEKAWAKNEEMVDWFAIQMPKLLAAFTAADAL